MRYIIDVDENKYICAILSDDKEYDFDKKIIRAERDDDMLILYSSKDDDALITIIPWVNINMLYSKSKQSNATLSD